MLTGLEVVEEYGSFSDAPLDNRGTDIIFLLQRRMSHTEIGSGWLGASASDPLLYSDLCGTPPPASTAPRGLGPFVNAPTSHNPLSYDGNDSIVKDILRCNKRAS